MANNNNKNTVGAYLVAASANSAIAEAFARMQSKLGAREYAMMLTLAFDNPCGYTIGALMQAAEQAATTAAAALSEQESTLTIAVQVGIYSAALDEACVILFG